MHFLLVHETRTDKRGCTFKHIIDSTPKPLVWQDGAKRLYKELALMICGGALFPLAGAGLLNVGLHLLLNAAAMAPASWPGLPAPRSKAPGARQLSFFFFA